MKYNIADIAAMVRGDLIPGTGSDMVENLLLDSRKIIFPSGSLFFALKGPRRDGHQFVKELYDKGVRHFVVEDGTAAPLFPGADFVVVKDTLEALQLLAASHRKQFNLPVIGISGSNGKTIVKEWLNQMLEHKYQVVRSPKSYNSQTGVPLSVWQINETHQLGIFEAGISHPDEMKRLERIIQPTIGIFTNIGEAHNEGFLSMRQKVNEKLQLFKNVNTLIYCKDYPVINEGLAAYVRQLGDESGTGKPALFSWSMKTDAVLRVTSIKKSVANTLIAATHAGRQISITIYFTDDASIENAITCWCTLLHMGIDDVFIEEQFHKLSQVAMRLELKKGNNNASIINDSYSADLSSLKLALNFLSQQQQHDKKTIILSDFLQSGKNEKDLYQEIAASLQHKGVYRFIGIGPQISRHHHSFDAIKGMQSFFYPDVEAFLKAFDPLSFSNETILLKGARVYEFERISRLLEQKAHQTVLEIDLNALLHNLKEYQKLLRPTTRIMAMVKAFSYGSGSYEIANLLQFHKVDYLAVAYADEGVELRKGGIDLPIMVMNPEESTFEAIVQYHLEPEIFSFSSMAAFDRFLKKKKAKAFPVHIELETGMNRLGFPVGDVESLAASLLNSSFIVKSVFTHLVASEDPEHDAFTQQQSEDFTKACEQIQKATGYSFLRHIDNSAGVSRHPDLQMDMVRLGIGLYGIDGAFNGQLDLKEVSRLKTTVAQIKHVKEGETVGYGRRGKVLRDTVIATVRLGYGDGYPRRLSNGVGRMMVREQLAPVVGSICMDMTMIDITEIEGVREGDEVIVFGKELPVTQLATWADTIPYEIMTGISQRVRRVYFDSE